METDSISVGCNYQHKLLWYLQYEHDDYLSKHNFYSWNMYGKLTKEMSSRTSPNDFALSTRDSWTFCETYKKVTLDKNRCKFSVNKHELHFLALEELSPEWIKWGTKSEENVWNWIKFWFSFKRRCNILLLLPLANCEMDGIVLLGCYTVLPCRVPR